MFMTSNKVNVDYCFPGFSATEIVACKLRVDEFTKGGYEMILGNELLTALVRDLKFYERVIIVIDGPFEV